MDIEQSKLLARMQQRAAGSYERAKQVEAKAGGRTLPGKLKNCVGKCTRLKLSESEKGNLSVYQYGTTIETPTPNPLEYRGISCGQNFGLWDDEYESFDGRFQKLLSNLKLLGFAEQLENCTEQEFFSRVFVEICDSVEKNPIYYLFNTSNRENKEGQYNIFIQGLVPPGYTPPANERENEHADKGYKPVAPGKPAAPAKPAAPGAKAAPPKASPPGKVPPKKGPPGKGAQPSAPVAVGEKAMVVGDPWGTGESYYGIIKRNDEAKKLSYIDFGSEGYEEVEVPFANVAPDDGKENAATIQPGTRIETIESFFEDGNAYPGECVSNDGTTVKVKFDVDGSIVDVPLESVRIAA